MKKKRLDALLVDRGLVGGRDKAKALIMQGAVFVAGQKAGKPGDEYPPDTPLEVRGKTLPYVSRGGLKLEKAIDTFALPVKGEVCADIGASTGGFTDCLLSRGAKKVYAVDVGYGQLAWSLRNDERVVVLERVNARYLTREQIPDKLGLITIDASFISLTLLLGGLAGLLAENGRILCLIKPQFEAGREHVGKKGVVRKPEVHLMVIEKIIAYAKEIDLTPIGLDFSPIKGPQGNIEYLLNLAKISEGGGGFGSKFGGIAAADVVSRAKALLEGKCEDSHSAEF